MTSKIALAVLKNVQDLETFTSRDVVTYFPAVPFSIIKESIKELVEEKKVFSYGVKRGTFYSVKPGLGEEDKSDELNPRMIEDVEKFVMARRDFSSSDLFAEFPHHQEHILRKILVHLRDDKNVLHLHGHGKASIWSQHETLPDEEEIVNEDQDNLKAQILEFAQKNLRWFKRSELDELFSTTAYEIRQALYALMDDGEIQMRGEKRSTEYAYCEVEDTSDEEEETGEVKANPELKQTVLEHIKKVGIATIPQLMEKFSTSRIAIVASLRELEEEEHIYHEGIKKTSKYIHKDVDVSKVETIVKEIREERKEPEVEKAIDKLSSLLLISSAVYVMFITSTKKYELRSFNTLQGGATVLFSSEDPMEVLQELFNLTKATKGVEHEHVI